MSLYDSSQFEIDDVGIPITGVAAYAPVTEANIIKDEDLGKATLTLPEAYRRLGLYKEDGGVEEERRLFYVAVTRAKDELILSYAKNSKSGFRAADEYAPSQFLIEAGMVKAH